MMPVKGVPCDVCGKEKNNAMEPRFYYTVCEDHYDVPPVDVSRLKEERLNAKS